ncbi:hypothetical protein [Parasphingorhabdus halotolerans]|uniref:Uncharacterized protein n=1 Tax=Parasphingorhabdus halotolerans TaxID=2725558 RepID=A0A6H2DK67_9SPHN|nr:hypothetical protein [Parasphingorhabdus halotolerans]QJB69069.1 hypothetical protein HF685_07045 [Parasphingorhabdus halotolerans]
MSAIFSLHQIVAVYRRETSHVSNIFPFAKIGFMAHRNIKDSQGKSKAEWQKKSY